MTDDMEEGETVPENTLNEASQDYDVQENEDGSATLIPVEDSEPTDPKEEDFYQNLVEETLDEATLNMLSTEYLDLIEVDKKAREKRDKQYAEAIQKSGLGDEAPGGADFEGANKVTHPLISEATVDFAARAIKELCPPDGPVKTKILGKSTPDKFRKAERKVRHMNWQLMTQMPEFRPCLEQILTQTALSGVQYSKTYHWRRGRRNKFEYVPMDDIYVPFHAPNFYSASRKTHAQRLNQLEFEERVASGWYKDWSINDRNDPAIHEITKSEEESRKVEGKEDPQYDDDGLRTVYEIYCWLELPDDSHTQGDYKYAPYIMTIDNSTEKVLSIYRNWDPDDETMTPLDWIIEWPFVPWRGAYAIGLGHLIGGLSSTATGALRALLDSAHINNAPTAIKLKGAQFGGQSESISITQIHEIEAAPGVDDIRKIAMPLPFNPPSPVLMELLGVVVEYGKGVVRTAIEADSNYSPNMPVGTEMSRVEQGMTVYASIHARLHRSMERQLAIVHRLNAQYLLENAEKLDEKQSAEHKNDLDDETFTPLAFKEDYLGEMDVQPVSDPNIFTEAQRFSQLQSVDALITKYPTAGFDVRIFVKRMLQLLKVPGIEELLPEPPAPHDENPATENIKLAMGQPGYVLPQQDHMAHLTTLFEFWKDPNYGGNPAIRPKFLHMAVPHATQHMLMLYGDTIRVLIEKASGGQPIKNLMSDDPELKELMSKTVAAAAPMAAQQLQTVLQEWMPLLAQGAKEIQAMMPPPAMDPSASALQQAQLKNQTDQAKLKSDEGIQQAQIQSDERIQTQKMQNDIQIENIKSQTALRKNEEDNITAMKIAQLRAETGGATGGLKDGTSLGTSMADGGLVTAMAAGGLAHDDAEKIKKETTDHIMNTIKDTVDHVGDHFKLKTLDLSPIVQAIQNIPKQPETDLLPVIHAIQSIPQPQQQDLSPILEAIKNIKMPEHKPIDLSSIVEALKNIGQNKTEGQQPQDNLDMKDLNENFRLAMEELINSHRELGKNMQDSHDKIIEAVKSKPKIKFSMKRNPDGSLTGGAEEEKPE